MYPAATGSVMAYAPDLPERLARLQRLYQERDTSVVLAKMEIPSTTLCRFVAAHTHGYCDYPPPEERVAFWDRCLLERKEVLDDSIPSVYLTEMDQGLYGALAGGEMRFLCDPDSGWISSMVAPILPDLAAVKELHLTREHPWFQRYLRQLQVFVEAARGKFGVSHFILIDALNFVFELIGATQTYLELIDRPELVQEAIAKAFTLNVMVQEDFFAKAGLLEGGTCSNMLQWAPGRIVSESVDPFHMTSVAYFDKWGRENVVRMFAQFDGGGLHIHGNGRHLLEAVASIPGLQGIYCGDDKDYPAAFSERDKLKARVGDVPLVMHVSYTDFAAALEARTLTGGVFYLVSAVPDTATANCCMAKVRQYEAA